MPRMRLLAASALVVSAGLAGISVGLDGMSAASAAPRSTRVGGTPHLPAGAVRRAALSPDTTLAVEVALQPRDPAALASYAQAVSTPGSPLYRHHISPSEFAADFGPTPGAIRTVDQALVGAGLHPGAASANHLSIPVRATAGQLSQAFDTSFDQYALPSGRVAYANTSAPQVEASAAAFVQGVVGLDDLDVATPSRSHPLSGKARSVSRPQVVTGGPQPCSAAVDDASSYGGYTADQIASAYGFSNLYGGNDLGAGQTVALVEFEPDLTSDIAAFQACYDTDTSVQYVKVDGGAGSGAGSGEAALDIEDVLGLAPQAKILVYQAPNNDAGSYDLYNAIVSQDQAQVISTSWGLCEQYEGSAATSENTLFEEAAVQGQTVVAAAGDDGTEDCSGSDASNDSLSVDDPASQPYVTGVGGTTLSALGPPPTESVWNDGVFGGAGGGGISADWTMPYYQEDAASSVGVIDAYSSAAPCGAPSGSYCREVPDVSADADEDTGIAFYYSRSWTVFGGTSVAAPIWAALIALTNASSSCAGTTVGFANPLLYRLAGTDPDSFHDITTGNNDIAGTSPVLYPALKGYDMASGLGTPDGAVLPEAMCDAVTVADPVTVTNPGNQSTYYEQAADLHILASDSTAGQTLGYTASGLPPGLSIDQSTGLISGTPTAWGSFTVVVTATDPSDVSGSVSFVWSVDLAITSADSADASVGSQFRFPVQTTGVPTSIKKTGSLPRGLEFQNLGGGTAVIKGTPSPRDLLGNYDLTITAVFGKGKAKQEVTQDFVLTLT